MYLIGRYQDGKLVDYARTGTNRREIRVYDSLDSAQRGLRAMRKRWTNAGFDLKIMKIVVVKEVEDIEN